MSPLENEDRANAHLDQERITHDQTSTRLKIIRSRKKVLMTRLQNEQSHVIEIARKKEPRTGSQLYRLTVTIFH